VQDTFTKQEIDDRRMRTIRRLIEQDSFLLTNDTNEQSITHRLAIYLESEFEGWDVDCEYNRNHDRVKTLRLRPTPLLSDDLNAQTVYPDVIVHKRDTDRNLLVIEAKNLQGRVRDATSTTSLHSSEN
jgi:hypothetical protein